MAPLERSELYQLLALSGPIVFYTFLAQVMQIITLYFVGRMEGSEYIGAATLGNMVCNITGYSLMIGMCSALDYLLSQAYGSKSYYLLGVHVQRAMLILTVFAIPVVITWSQTDLILTYLLGIDANIARLACQWARILSPGLFPILIFEALKRWLQCQNILWPTTVSSALSGLLNFLLNYLFFYQLNLGYEGIAGALVISQWFQLLVMITILVLRKYFIYRIFRRHYSYISNSYWKYIIIDIMGFTYGSNNSHNSSSNSSTSITAHTASELSHDRAGFLREYELFEQGDQHHVQDIYTKHDDDQHTLLPTTNTLGELHPRYSTGEADPEDNFPMCEPAILDDWMAFLKLGIPGALSLFVEW